MKRKIRSWLSYERSDGDVHHPVGVSMTVPDQAQSLRDLLKLHVQGVQIPFHSSSFQDEDDDFVIPDLREMDLSDLEDFRADLKARVSRIRSDITARKKALQAARKAPVKEGSDPAAGMRPNSDADFSTNTNT